MSLPSLLEVETNTLIHDMVIELEDFGFPSSLRTSSVAVTTNSGTPTTDDDYTFTPEDVAISGEKLLLSMGDITEDTAGIDEDPEWHIPTRRPWSRDNRGYPDHRRHIQPH